MNTSLLLSAHLIVLVESLYFSMRDQHKKIGCKTISYFLYFVLVAFKGCAVFPFKLFYFFFNFASCNVWAWLFLVVSYYNLFNSVSIHFLSVLLIFFYTYCLMHQWQLLGTSMFVDSLGLVMITWWGNIWRLIAEFILQPTQLDHVSKGPGRVSTDIERRSPTPYTVHQRLVNSLIDWLAEN